MRTSYAARHAVTTDSTRRVVTERLSTGSLVWRVGLLVLFLVSVYVEVPLYITNSFFVPSFFTLLVLVPILALMYHRRIYKYEAAFLGQIVLVLLLTALLSPGIAYLNEKLVGLVQTALSIAAGVLLLKLLADLPRRWVANVLGVLCITLIAGATLEVLGVIRDASDSFREAAFSRGGYGVYDSTVRDEQITGFIRPKLFTSEPSLLAIGFLAFVNSWLVLTYNKKRLVVAGLGTAIMLVLTGSPILVLSFVASLAIAWSKEPGFTSFALVCTLAGVIGISLALIQPEIISNVSERFAESLQNAGTMRATSENRRVIFPYVTLIDVLQRSPIFGVGISGKEVVGRYASLLISPQYALGNNVLAMFITYTGIVGASLFSGVVFVYWRRLGVRSIVLLLILVLILSQTIGGFETPRFWGYVFLFTGVVKMGYGEKPKRRKQASSGTASYAASSGERNNGPESPIQGNSRVQKYV